MNSFSPPLMRGILNRIFSIKRRTWMLLTAALFVLMALVIWATISAASWLLGIARDGVNAAPEVVRSASSLVEQVIPSIQDKLAVLLPALTQKAPPREVSGTDPGPVARFPGLLRVQWQHDDQETQVRYEGKVEFADVLKHYVQGFSEHGYRHEIMSTTPAEERHEFIKDSERIGLVFSAGKNDVITVDLSVRKQSTFDHQTQL